MKVGEAIETQRTTLHVRDAGSGPPLVLLHGWPQSSYCWEPVLPALAANFRCIRPDLRGLGYSSRTLEMPAYRKAELAADIIALLDTMGVAEFGLVGHDWGGAVAQEIAFAVPERVRRLAIMNIHLLANRTGLAAAERSHAERHHRAYWYQHFMQTAGLSEALVPGNERVWLGVFLRGKDRAWQFPAAAVDEYVRCYQRPHTATTGANYYRAMRLDAQRWKTLAGRRLGMPTALIWGMHDPVVLPAFLEGHEACFDDVIVTPIEASHFLAEERPAEVAMALRAHFEPLLGPVPG